VNQLSGRELIWAAGVPDRVVRLGVERLAMKPTFTRSVFLLPRGQAPIEVRVSCLSRVTQAVVVGRSVDGTSNERRML
jgi:hypothetical protein